VNPEELLRDLDLLIHEFPPREGLDSILKVAAPEQAARFHPVMDQLLFVLQSKSPASVGVSQEGEAVRLLTRASRDRPIQILCACIHNYNRSPAMAASLKSILDQKGLLHKVSVNSGGIAPIPRPNLQLLAIQRARGIAAEAQRPRPIPDRAEKTIARINPAEEGTTVIPVKGEIPEGDDLTLIVTVYPVAGEAIVDNNEAAYQVRFGG
jgi:hypothetical protein